MRPLAFLVATWALVACASAPPVVPLTEGPSIEDPPPAAGIGLFVRDPADLERFNTFSQSVRARHPDTFRLEREGVVQQVKYDGVGFDYVAEGGSSPTHQRCLYLDGTRLSGCKAVEAPPPTEP